MPLDMWVVLALALVLFLVAVPLLVFICVRGEAWVDEAPPVVRWLQTRRIKAFATAAAAGDFLRAESLIEGLMAQTSAGAESGP